MLFHHVPANYESYRVPYMVPSQNFIPAQQALSMYSVPTVPPRTWYSAPAAIPMADVPSSQPKSSPSLKFGIDSILGLQKAYEATRARGASPNSHQNSIQGHPNYPVPSRVTISPPAYPNYPHQMPLSPSISEFGLPRTDASGLYSANTEVGQNNFGSMVITYRGKYKPKRSRTIFTTYQMAMLEQEFSRTQYMVGEARRHLASSLNLKANQVKIWFQNRRIKWRRQNLQTKKVDRRFKKRNAESKSIVVPLLSQQM